MTTLNRASTICAFCCQSTPNSVFADADLVDGNTNENESAALVNRFLSLLERFLLEQGTSGDFKGPPNGLDCCEMCLDILGSFCESYHQLKCLQLQLEWTLRRLVNIMKPVDTLIPRRDKLQEMFESDVPSLHSHNKESAEIGGEDSLVHLECFRHKLIERCTRHLSKSQPRVSVKPSLEGDDDTIKSSIRLRVIPEDVQAAHIHSKELHGHKVLFGWVVSFAAVIALLTPNSRDSLCLKTKSHALSPTEKVTSNKARKRLQLTNEQRLSMRNDIPRPETSEDSTRLSTLKSNTNLRDDNESSPLLSSDTVTNTVTFDPPCDVVHGFLPSGDITSSTLQGNIISEKIVIADGNSGYSSEGNESLDAGDKMEFEDEEEMEIGSFQNDVKIVEAEPARVSILTSDISDGLLEERLLLPRDDEQYIKTEHDNVDNVAAHDHSSNDSNPSTVNLETTDIKVPVETTPIIESVPNCTCPKCGRKFHHKSQLNIHMKKSHPSNCGHQCPECGKSFRMYKRLTVHRFIHRDPETWKYKCVTCGKKFYNNTSLKSHMLAHAKGVSKKCKFCSAQFTDSHELIKHVRVEHIDKDNVGNCEIFSCTECDSKFVNKGSLTNHMSIVHSRESHKCQKCGKDFKTKHALSRHEVIHSDPSTWKFKCSLCDRRCYRKENLAKHMITHQ